MEIELGKIDGEAIQESFMQTFIQKGEVPIYKRLSPRKNQVECCSDSSHNNQLF